MATARHDDAERTMVKVEEVKVEAAALVQTPAAEREPESEEATATTPARASSASCDASAAAVPFLEDDDAKIKCDEQIAVEDDGDVEMECHEAAEELDPDDASDEDDRRYGSAAYAVSSSSFQYGADLEATPVREYPEEYAKYQMPEKDAAILSSGVALSPVWSGKRKRSPHAPSGSTVSRSSAQEEEDARVVINGIDMGKPLGMPTKRKGSSDFLRKGQWTPTEERLARLLIEAFEEGYLPIYTGIRLRGYLAVQLQCDPMRVSKKLCAGTIDGKRIAKNYGQKKFRLRKKLLWDREEAGRILATLERLTKELWCETGMPAPQYLTLSTTRNAEDESSPSSGSAGTVRSQPSPVKKLSPPANKSKKQKTGVVFPIIYLNLSKKLKQSQGNTIIGAPQSGGSVSTSFTYDNVIHHYGIDSPYVHNPDGSIHVVGFSAHPNDSDASSTSSAEGQAVKVDGESLQAAYELLNLHQLCSSPSGSPTSTSSTMTPAKATVAHEGHHNLSQQHHEKSDIKEEKAQTCTSSPSTTDEQSLTRKRTPSISEDKPGARTIALSSLPQPTGVVPIRPAPPKPTILRQHAPTVSS